MEILLVIFAVGTFGGFAMAIRGANEKAAVQKRLLDEQSAREDVKRELADTRTEVSDLKKKIGKKDKEARELKDELKAQRQKAHDRLKDAESLQKELERTREQHAALGGVGEMREELMEAKSEAARLQTELARLRAENSALGVVQSPAGAPAVDGEDAEARAERHRAEAGNLRGRLKAQADELMRSFNEQIGKERDRAGRELRDLRRRLSRALNEVERERRRADNNDKAYFILKNQLESTLDRLAALDPNLSRPDAMTPEEIARRLAARVQHSVDNTARQADASPAADPSAGTATTVAVAEPEPEAGTDAAEANTDEAAAQDTTDSGTSAGEGDEKPASPQESTTSTASGDDSEQAAEDKDAPEEASEEKTADGDAEAADDKTADGGADASPAQRPVAPLLTPGATAAVSALDDDDDGWDDLDETALARVSGNYAAVPDDEDKS